MENERQQELISAYLDGEVTADEQRAVETLLAESDEARELLAELRGLQTRVRELPKFSLGADFSQTVLDEAERTMISGSAVAAADAADVADAADNNGDLDETGDDHDLHVFYAEQDRADRAAVLKRRIVWSALAVAAALLMMVVFPEQEPNNTARHDHGADTTAAKSADELDVPVQAVPEEASAGKPGRSLSVSAAVEATDAERDKFAEAATERKSLQVDPAQPGIAKSPEESAKVLTQDGAPAAGAAPTDADDRRVAGLADRVALGGSARAASALRAATEAGEVQIAARFDGAAVFEIDQQSFASINGLNLAGNFDAPAADGQALFRAVPLDKLADLRTAPVTDEAEVDLAKAAGVTAEQVYWTVVEGTSDQIQRALAKLQTPGTYYQAVEMNPQLAIRLESINGGQSLARVNSRAVGDAKQQSLRPAPIGAIADAEAPATATDAVAAAPSKPAPAVALTTDPAGGAARQRDKADAGNTLRKVNGAPEPVKDRNRTISPSAPPQPAATPAATEIDGLAAKKSEEANELAKRVARFAQGEFRSRPPARRELQEPLSETPIVAENEKTDDDEKKAAKEGADREATEKKTEKQVQPQASSRPVPVAEPSDELPSLQRSKMKDTGAEKTYRVLVVVSVQAGK